MKKIWKNDYEVENFWTKLMAFSRSINKIPDYYLSYSENARIYDWWIWPRKWSALLAQPIWTWKTNCAFILKWKLYQITNKNLYEIWEDWSRTLQHEIWYDKKTDVIVYNADELVEIAIMAAKWEWLKYFKWWEVFECEDDLVEIDWEVLVHMVPELTEIKWSETWAKFVLHSIDKESNKITWWKLEWEFNTTETLFYTYWETVYHADWKTTSEFRTVNIARNLSNVKKAHVSWWIIEHYYKYNFASKWNILYITPELEKWNLADAINFVGAWTTRLTFESEIIWLKATMSWMYIFTKKKIWFLDKECIVEETVYWSSAKTIKFIPKQLWEWWELTNDMLIAGADDTVYYFTESRNVWMINYIPWTYFPWLSKLNIEPIVWIRDFLNDLERVQEDWFAFYNQNENNLQFFLRTNGAIYNNICLVYDLTNLTWSIDTGRYYSYLINWNGNTYWFSDLDSSIFLDAYWNSDSGEWINFRLATQNFNFDTCTQKLFRWFFLSGRICELSEINIKVYVDWEWVFEDTIDWLDFISKWAIKQKEYERLSDYTWEVWWAPIWWVALWLHEKLQLREFPFDIRADIWQINICWTRIQVEISCNSLVSSFLLDRLWITKQETNFTDIGDKF